METMTIGDLAKVAGVPPRTIRFYESKGVLPIPGRSSSGYRLYRPDDLKRLSQKYPSIRDDIEDIRNMVREDAHIGLRCLEFPPEDWIFRIGVSISLLGPKGKDRCSLICEKDGQDCYFLLAYDNDSNVWGVDIIDKIIARKDVS